MMGELTDHFAARFSPWQIMVSTLSVVYAIRNTDSLLGLGCQYTTLSSFHYILVHPLISTP